MRVGQNDPIRADDKAGADATHRTALLRLVGKLELARQIAEELRQVLIVRHLEARHARRGLGALHEVAELLLHLLHDHFWDMVLLERYLELLP